MAENDAHSSATGQSSVSTKGSKAKKRKLGDVTIKQEAKPDHEIIKPEEKANYEPAAKVIKTGKPLPRMRGLRRAVPGGGGRGLRRGTEHYFDDETIRQQVKQEHKVKQEDKGHYKPAVKVMYIAFPREDRLQLIINIKNQAPKRDMQTYKTRINRIDWSKVAFKEYSLEDCRTEWEVIQSQIRKVKTLIEVCNDALNIQNDPNLRRRRALHPDMPKRPLTAFFMFYKDKNKKYKEKHPGASQPEISKQLSEKFKTLSEKKKNKYLQNFEKEMEKYNKDMETFMEEHPEFKPELKDKQPTAKPPKLKTPYVLWTDKKMTDYSERDPEANRAQLETQMREEWKAMPDKKKIKWIKKAIEEKPKYEQELEHYCLLHPNYKIPENKKPLLNKHETDLKEQLVDGKPVKPPMNAYSMFCAKILKQANSNMSPKERMAECTIQWNKLTNLRKEQYKTEAARLKEEYTQNLIGYTAKLSPDKAEPFKKELEALLKSSAKKSGKKSYIGTSSTSSSKVKVTRRPKKPVDGQFLYVEEHRRKAKKKNPKKNATEITRMLVKQFNELSQKKKDKYNKKATEAREDGNRENGETERMTSRDMYINNKIGDYMTQNKVTKQKALAALRKQWETLPKEERLHWLKESAAANKLVADMQKDKVLLKNAPQKPFNSAYKFFTSEMMQSDDLRPLGNNDRIKEVGRRWRELKPAEKKKYEAKKEGKMKVYRKALAKYKRGLSKEDQARLDEVLKPKKKRSAPKIKQETLSESEEEESESGSESGEESESGSSSGSGSGAESESGSGSEQSSGSSSEEEDEEGEENGEQEEDGEEEEDDDDDDEEEGGDDEEEGNDEDGSGSESGSGSEEEDDEDGDEEEGDEEGQEEGEGGSGSSSSSESSGEESDEEE